jgi:hypothetical protein
MTEIAITVKDSEQSLTQKHLVHDTIISVAHEDLTLKRLVESAIKDFHGHPEDVLVKIKYVW